MVSFALSGRQSQRAGPKHGRVSVVTVALHPARVTAPVSTLFNDILTYSYSTAATVQATVRVCVVAAAPATPGDAGAGPPVTDDRPAGGALHSAPGVSPGPGDKKTSHCIRCRRDADVSPVSSQLARSRLRARAAGRRSASGKPPSLISS